MASLSRRERLALALQRAIARATGLVWVPAAAAWMRLRGYQIDGVRELRRRYQKILRESDAPLLVCANHLTLVDSFLVSWALGSPWFYVRRFSTLPWNLPDRQNFAATFWRRASVYAMKCLPIPRRGRRQEVAGVLQRFGFLLARGEVGLVFPEGGRSRTGRVQLEDAAAGVGRLIGQVPGCRVLCVYLRGERQERYSDLPARGERFRVLLDEARPQSQARGLRRSVEIARQVTSCLVELEQRWFDGRR